MGSGVVVVRNRINNPDGAALAFFADRSPAQILRPRFSIRNPASRRSTLPHAFSKIGVPNSNVGGLFRALVDCQPRQRLSLSGSA